tara:strand:+ start:10361 stop:11149 length:789 start_codon:yes stop_codon:yes gene_type:complete
MEPAFTETDTELFKKYIKNAVNYFEYGSGGSTYLAYKQNKIENIIAVESCKSWINKILRELQEKKISKINDKKIKKKLKFKFIQFTNKVANLGLPIFEKKSNVKFLKNIDNVGPNQLVDYEISRGTIKEVKLDSSLNVLYNIKHNDTLLEDIHPKLVIPEDKNILKKYVDYSSVITKYQDINFDLILIDGRCRVASALTCHNIIDENCIVLIDDFIDRKCYHMAVLDYYDIIEKGERMIALKKKTNKKLSLEELEKYKYDIR